MRRQLFNVKLKIQIKNQLFISISYLSYAEYIKECRKLRG